MYVKIVKNERVINTTLIEKVTKIAYWEPACMTF